MTKTIAIRQGSFTIACAAALLCICGVTAQAQSAQRADAKIQPKAVVGDNSVADAAAYAKLNAGQVEEAVTAFQAVLAAQPNDASALSGMGQARILQGNYLGAVSFLEQAKLASPNDAAIGAALDSARFQFLMSEGRDAQTAKDPADAEKRYREALELQPGARQAVNGLVNALVLENKLGDAQDALSTAVAHDAAASGHPSAELELELAQLDIANSQPQMAYPIFLQVLQDNPKRVDAWSGLVSALHLMGHDTDAVAQEKAIPDETRAQLETAPGFQQMMTAMANSPARPTAAGQPSYTLFVPSPAPAVIPTVGLPAPVAAPAAPSLASVPVLGTPQREKPPVGRVSAKPTASRAGVVSSSPKPAASLQAAKPLTTAAETTAPSHPASGLPLVTQPAARPAGRSGEIPDTGEQQYPQPKVRPRTPASSN